MTQALSRHKFGTILGDAGYESERAHEWCRERLGVRSIFPTTVRGKKCKDGSPRAVRGRYRIEMRERFPREEYAQRAQVETVFSMLKRNLGSALRARKRFTIDREAVLRLITHNLMVLKRRRGMFSMEPDSSYLSLTSIHRTPPEK